MGARPTDQRLARRNPLGVTPVARLNPRANWLDPPKPLSRATSVIESAGSASSAFANASDLLTRLGADAIGNAVLDLGGGNTVTLLGVPPSSATVDWFRVV